LSFKNRTIFLECELKYRSSRVVEGSREPFTYQIAIIKRKLVGASNSTIIGTSKTWVFTVIETDFSRTHSKNLESYRVCCIVCRCDCNKKSFVYCVDTYH